LTEGYVVNVASYQHGVDTTRGRRFLRDRDRVDRGTETDAALTPTTNKGPAGLPPALIQTEDYGHGRPLLWGQHHRPLPFDRNPRAVA
jgi:hypothetical protein